MSTLVKERKLKPQFIKMALETELKHHDWTYEYSDDHGVWRSGSAHQDKIKKIVGDCYAEGEDPADLFYKYWPGPPPANGPYMYGIKRTWEEQLDKRAKEISEEDIELTYNEEHKEQDE